MLIYKKREKLQLKVPSSSDEEETNTTRVTIKEASQQKTQQRQRWEKGQQGIKDRKL